MGPLTQTQARINVGVGRRHCTTVDLSALYANYMTRALKTELFDSTYSERKHST